MTVLDKPAIKRLVLALRHALEDDYEAVLRRYGLFADRDWVAPEKLPRATPELLHERARMVAAMQPELSRIKAAGTKDASKAQQEATRWYVREAAFTMLNRLVGLKCLEVRKLFLEVIQTAWSMAVAASIIAIGVRPIRLRRLAPTMGCRQCSCPHSARSRRRLARCSTRRAIAAWCCRAIPR